MNVIITGSQTEPIRVENLHVNSAPISRLLNRKGATGCIQWGLEWEGGQTESLGQKKQPGTQGKPTLAM